MSYLTCSVINGVCRRKKGKRKEVCGRGREKLKRKKEKQRHKERKEKGRVGLTISPLRFLIDKLIMHFLKLTYTPKL